MVDITQKPYFSYNQAIEQLMQPIQSQADVRFLGHARMFENRDRFQICSHKVWSVDFYTRELYRYGLYEKPIHELPSGFNMWDHLPYAPPEIYVHTRKTFGIAHGLTIVKNHGEYVDSFVFATTPGNNQINNFYLNQKERFESFVENFSCKLAKTLEDLKSHTFSIPSNIQFRANPISLLSPRQKECAILLTQGSKTKEIAQKLSLSPRTVEYHIDAVREKFQAKNRPELIYVMGKIV